MVILLPIHHVWQLVWIGQSFVWFSLRGELHVAVLFRVILRQFTSQNVGTVHLQLLKDFTEIK